MWERLWKLQILQACLVDFGNEPSHRDNYCSARPTPLGSRAAARTSWSLVQLPHCCLIAVLEGIQRGTIQLWAALPPVQISVWKSWSRVGGSPTESRPSLDQPHSIYNPPTETQWIFSVCLSMGGRGNVLQNWHFPFQHGNVEIPMGRCSHKLLGEKLGLYGLPFVYGTIDVREVWEGLIQIPLKSVQGSPLRSVGMDCGQKESENK